MMSDSKHSAGHKVLLVDHQDDTSRNVAFLLHLAGYEMATVAGLEEAINLVSAFCPEGDCPAVILLNNLEITSDLHGKIELLATQCQNSRILVVNRGELAGNLDELKHRVVAPNHILGEIKKAISEQVLIDDVSKNFRRFHTCTDRGNHG